MLIQYLMFLTWWKTLKYAAIDILPVKLWHAEHIHQFQHTKLGMAVGSVIFTT